MGSGFVTNVLMGIVALLLILDIFCDVTRRSKCLGRPLRFERLPRGVPFRVVREVDIRRGVLGELIQEVILQSDVTGERQYVERIVEGENDMHLPHDSFVLLGYGTEARIEKAWMQHSWSDR